MFTLNCRGRILAVDKPIAMGIINATPDSFYSDSRFTGVDAILKQAEKMINEGASILDIGGQSTRPGSEAITEEMELQRVINPIKAVAKEFPQAFISIDTYYSKVVREAVEAGAGIVNDISGGKWDERLRDTVISLRVPYVLMHIKGKPQTMQDLPQYENVTREVLDYFIREMDLLHKAGQHDLIIDPGIGFGKTIQHNFQLLHDLGLFRMLKAPLLLGVSRKGTIYKTLGITANDSLNGTTVLNTIGLMNGACILRVHDVKEAVEAIRLYTACQDPAK